MGCSVSDMEPNKRDIEALKREKPDWTEDDLRRLALEEPLAYVLGHIPFLGLSIRLDSPHEIAADGISRSRRPLIPRPETEWWTELFIKAVNDRTTIYGSAANAVPVRVLDLCAGSGAIGLSILKHCKHALVSFGELVPEHARLIRLNIEHNGLAAERADVRSGDLFAPFPHETFDIIATNPPYIPEGRPLPESVARYEPAEALYAGTDGLALIRRILAEAPAHLAEKGELWMECDFENAEAAAELAREAGARRAEVREDSYGRPRLLVAYY